MSIIKTKSGWVELGAGNPLEQAFETAGGRAIGATVPKVKRCSHNVLLPMHGERVTMFDEDATHTIRRF